MKKKLTNVFILITTSLAAIIIFQFYWTVNAYHVNKKNFGIATDQAMQQAMEDCKKDYFDSIRKVLIIRLSPPNITIKIDTVPEADTAHAQYKIHFNNTSAFTMAPFTTFKQYTDFYRKKIVHKSSLPELFTEMSFYDRALMQQFTLILGLQDITKGARIPAVGPQSSNSVVRQHGSLILRRPFGGIYELPKNYRQADSTRLCNYLRGELLKKDIDAPFTLHIAKGKPSDAPPAAHTLETGAYSYKYHGFILFNISGDEFFMKATFANPLLAVVKSMLVTLLLSLLLIIFTVFCFLYIIRIILQQKKLADMKDDFINNITHELKTPIATLTVAIEALQNFNALNDPEKTQRYLQTSRKQLTQLNDLVTKVLNISLFENHEVGLIKEPIDFSNIINEIVTDQNQHAQKAVTFNFKNNCIVNIITVDPFHFKNMMVNLIDNAIKYSGEQVNITIACSSIANDLIISVQDNGIGISAVDQAQVFDKFYRVSTGNVHSIKGTGLGLSYVKYIAEAHGGTVSLTSSINKGTTFIVSLPLNHE